MPTQDVLEKNKILLQKMYICLASKLSEVANVNQYNTGFKREPIQVS